MEYLLKIIASREFMATATVVVLIPLFLLVRYVFAKRYLRQRLFFEPWINLSGDNTLDIGASLSEVLYFELEGLRELLTKARRKGGLWNERSTMPLLERLFEGYPEFVRHIELLGLPGRVSKLVRFMLAVNPPRIHGTIHKFGNSIRFQVMLDGIVIGTSPSTSADNDQEADESPRVGWFKQLPSEDHERIPEAIKEIAHQVVLDLGNVRAFKSAESFMHFTNGLREHLAFNELHGRDELGRAACEHYERAKQSEGKNPLASYAIAQINYLKYDSKGNETAIREYQNALQSEVPAVRARAFRGLADAYCQLVHRHKRKTPDVLEGAMRWANFAKDLFDGDAKEHCNRLDEASIRKALAFAIQTQAEADGLDLRQKEDMIEKAMNQYKEAVSCDSEFTVAHNNLGYLYLERAKRRLNDLADSDASQAGDRTGFELARNDLEEAMQCCRTASHGDPTYHHAYDNLGNICVERSRLPDADKEEELNDAENWYFMATAYCPGYDAAYADLSHLYLIRASDLRLREKKGDSSEAAMHDRMKSEVHRAWKSHHDCLRVLESDDSKRRRCDEFKEWLERHKLDSADLMPEDGDTCSCQDGFEQTAKIWRKTHDLAESS